MREVGLWFDITWFLRDQGRSGDFSWNLSEKLKNTSVYRGFFNECVDELAIPDIEFPGIDLSFK